MGANEKMAKEKKGDDRKFRLVDPAVPILRRVSGSRTARAFFMRKTTANLMERLTNEEQDAMIQIAIIWTAMTQNHGYRQMRYGELAGKAVEEYSASMIDMIKRFRDWESIMLRYYPECLDLTKSICVEDHTIKSMTIHIGKRWSGVMQMFRIGLTEWVKLSPHRIYVLTINDNYIQ